MLYPQIKLPRTTFTPAQYSDTVDHISKLSMSSLPWYPTTSRIVPCNAWLSARSKAMILSPITSVPLSESVVHIQIHVNGSCTHGDANEAASCTSVQTALPQCFLEPAHSCLQWQGLSFQTGTQGLVFRLAPCLTGLHNTWKSVQRGSFPRSATKSESWSRHKCLQICCRFAPSLRFRCWKHQEKHHSIKRHTVIIFWFC